MFKARFHGQFRTFSSLLITVFVGATLTNVAFGQSLNAAQPANQITQLSKVPAGSAVSDYTLYDYKVSADGATAVYRTSQPYSSADRLISVPTNGSRAPKQLNLTLPMNGTIKDFSISSDGKYVVYEADQRVAGQYELYSVLINGGTPKLLSFLPGNAGSVNTHQISPDSRYVVYKYENNDGATPINQLYTVPIRGGAAFKLSQTIGCDGQTSDAKSAVVFTPNSQYILFQYSITASKPGCVPTDNGAFNLYSIPVAGGSAKFLSAKFSPEILVTSDSSTVVFTADLIPDGSDSLQLYSVPVTGGPILRLSQIDEMVSANNQDVREFDIAFPYPVIVYAYRRAGDPQYYNSSPRAFGFVMANGTRPYNYPINQDILNFKISPNNRGLVFLSAIPTADGSDTINKLFSVTFQNNGRVQQLSDGEIPISDNYQITSDGQRVVYQTAAGDLSSVSINGGTILRIANQVSQFALTPNGQAVVYPSTPENSTSLSSLKVTSLVNGSTQTLVSYGVDVLQNDKLRFLTITGDGRRVVFVRGVYDRNGNPVLDEAGSPVEQLYSVTLPQYAAGQALQYKR